MGNEKILIVEAEALCANDIRHKLNDLGYPITDVARTSKEAIRKTEEIHPDLVLVDMILQGKMNGFKIAEKIQSKYEVPIIYLTDNFDQSTHIDSLESKPFGFLIKPVNDHELSSAVETALFTR